MINFGIDVRTMLKPFIIGIGFNIIPKNKRGDWLRKNLEKSGPTYIKIGQFISNRSDIFGKDVSMSLKSLQDTVEPIEWDSLAHLVPLEKFQSVDRKPIATASVAQVHRAKLNGRDVVLKIKKPGINRQLEDDVNGLKMLLQMFPFVDPKFLDEFERTLRKELDFKRELKNLIEFGEIYSQSSDVIVPKAYPAQCTDDILVMEYAPSDKSPVRSKTLINLFISQLLFENVIHGDLHSGNIGTRGSSVILYDFGNVIRTSTRYRTSTRDFIYYVQQKDVDNTINTMKNMGMVIKNMKMTESFVNKFLRYIETLDVKSFKFDADEITEKVPVEIDATTTCILRSFSLLEGYCKSQDPDFSYDDILVQNLEILYMDIEYIFYRAKKDFELLQSGS